MSLVEIDEIPDVLQKSLPSGWREFENIPTNIIPLLEEYEQRLMSGVPSIALLKVVIDTGDHAPRWSQPYQTTEFKRGIIKN